MFYSVLTPKIFFKKVSKRCFVYAFLRTTRSLVVGRNVVLYTLPARSRMVAFRATFLRQATSNQQPATSNQQPAAKLHSPSVAFRWRVPANHQPTNHQPTTNQPPANHQPSPAQPTSQPPANQPSQPPANHQPTTNQPPANHQPTTSQPPANRTQDALLRPAGRRTPCNGLQDAGRLATACRMPDAGCRMPDALQRGRCGRHTPRGSRHAGPQAVKLPRAS